MQWIVLKGKTPGMSLSHNILGSSSSIHEDYVI